MNVVQHVLILGVRLYRWVISPAKPLLFGPVGRCRFTPTCSQYALDALRTHGALRGGGLALRRICRCHPWGDCGEDPVPAAKPGMRKPKPESPNRRGSAIRGLGHPVRVLKLQGQRHS